MSGVSPSSVLFNSDGYEMAVSHNQPFSTERRALIMSGLSLGTNRHLMLATTGDAILGSAQLANKQQIQIASTVTASGSADTSSLFNGAQEVTLVVNVGTVTGAGSIQYSIQQRDPGDGTTLYGPVASTVVINNGNAPGVFTATLSLTSATDVHIVWTVIGTFSATIYSTIITKTTPSSQVISGSITATNPSVGTDGAAAVASDTQVGGIVSLNNPTYTAGNLNALSLTTEGGLRVFADGYVTTAAPTYTNNTSAGLSLTTAGALRVDGSATTQPVSGTVTVNQGTSPWVTSVSNTVTVTGTVAVTQSTSPWIVAGGGTAGSPASGVVTVQGISGMTPIQVTTNKATASTVTGVSVTANANTTILASNANRLAASIFNNTSKTMYIKLGATASTSSFTVQLFASSYWEVPSDYTGIIDSFSPTGTTGTALVTEMTP